jgi:hypothetical protein
MVAASCGDSGVMGSGSTWLITAVNAKMSDFRFLLSIGNPAREKDAAPNVCRSLGKALGKVSILLVKSIFYCGDVQW